MLVIGAILIIIVVAAITGALAGGTGSIELHLFHNTIGTTAGQVFLAGMVTSAVLLVGIMAGAAGARRRRAHRKELRDLRRQQRQTDAERVDSDRAKANRSAADRTNAKVEADRDAGTDAETVTRPRFSPLRRRTVEPADDAVQPAEDADANRSA